MRLGGRRARERRRGCRGRGRRGWRCLRRRGRRIWVGKRFGGAGEGGEGGDRLRKKTKGGRELHGIHGRGGGGTGWENGARRGESFKGLPNLSPEGAVSCETVGVNGTKLVLVMVGGAVAIVLVFQALNQWG